MTDIEQSDFDSPWKDILEIYFTEFMAFFFPQAYDDIDWSKGYESLDTELQQIVQDSELGKRIVDKLVKVWLKNGEESWILIHIEIQSQRETNFAKRMYIYNYRIFDRYDRFVISLAILGDEHPLWKPNQFGYGMWGFKVGIEFPIIKLLDYKIKWNELEESRNPFAIVVMSHLKAQETSNNGEDRRKWKFYLARLLYERGYKREDIIQLLKFIDWIMKLPENLDIKFWQEVRQLEEGKTMPYISSLERIAIKSGLEKGLQQGIQQGIQQGMQQGIQQGMQQGMQQEVRRLLIQILDIKFKTVPENIVDRINNIANTEKLEILHHHAVLCDSIKDFEKKLDDVISNND